jgi:hypothetical protein
MTTNFLQNVDKYKFIGTRKEFNELTSIIHNRCIDIGYSDMLIYFDKGTDLSDVIKNKSLREQLIKNK